MEILALHEQETLSYTVLLLLLREAAQRIERRTWSGGPGSA